MSDAQASVLSQEDLTSAVLGLQNTINNSTNCRDRPFDHVDGRLERIDTRLDRVDGRLAALEGGQRRLEAGQTHVAGQVETLRTQATETERQRNYAVGEVIGTIRDEFLTLRSAMEARFAKVHGEMETRFGKVHGEIDQLRSTIDHRFADVDGRFDEMGAQVLAIDMQMRAIAEAVGAPIVESPRERSN